MKIYYADESTDSDGKRWYTINGGTAYCLDDGGRKIRGAGVIRLLCFTQGGYKGGVYRSPYTKTQRISGGGGNC